jgi:hypothetical protein
MLARAIDLELRDCDRVDLVWDLAEDVVWTSRVVRGGRHGRRWFRCLTFSHLSVITIGYIIGAFSVRLGFMIFDVHL